MLQTQPIDRDWKFRRLNEAGAPDEWTPVNLPHSPVCTDIDGHGHWFGLCEYSRRVQSGRLQPGTRCVLFLGAAMHTATVFIDGVRVGEHVGGYLPFEVDLTAQLASGAERELIVRLDNRDNLDVPPGKPFADLDFCWYSGLYRNAELRVYPPVHITDAVAAGEVAGGGVFARTLRASAAEAVVSVKAHIRNAGTERRMLICDIDLLHEGRSVASGRARMGELAPGGETHAGVELTLKQPALWSPQSPLMHTVRVRVVDPSGIVCDTREVRFGIRELAFSRSGGFQVNGRRMRLRGTNRHQDYPWAGYALPRAAQRRDAVRIKEAGFDYVRLSHYPQSPDFLDACDELGIVVMNCIPGWQFIGGKRFRELSYLHARELIRRDRNHPCVVLWELSLNETAMDDEFMDTMMRLAHEEYPGGQMFACGWIDRYDVFTHSRQHGEIHRWKNGDRALVIAEYGDWEFYAANEGFDQKTGAGLHAAWSTSRQFRAGGETALRQQADNHVIALNDTLSSPAVLDGHWSMFDYPRGYHPERAGSGVMDFFRLPKFSYYLYRTQRDVAETGAGWQGGATVFIASHWTPRSNLRIVVFSNCEEVELRLNGRSLGRSRVAGTWMSQFLPHPPFYFDAVVFEAGELQALGYVGGKQVAAHTVRTPGQAVALSLHVDQAGIHASAGEPDLLFVHARLCDEHGQLCVGDTSTVEFSVEGDAILESPSSITCEAGIASTLVRVPAGSSKFVIRAQQPSGLSSLQCTASWQRCGTQTEAPPR